MNYFKYIILLLSSYNSYASEVSLGLVVDSKVIVGDNNSIQETNITLRDSGVEVYLDIAKKEDIKKISTRQEDAWSCTEYKTESVLGRNMLFPYIPCHGYTDSDYLLNYVNNKAIGSIGEISHHLVFPDSVTMPILEMRIINNTNKTISLKETIFNIKESEPYQLPFIFILRPYDSPGYLTLANEGNTTIDEISLEYWLPINSHKKYKVEKKYYYSSDLPFFSIDFKDMLIEEGVDIEYLRTLDWANLLGTPLSNRAKQACGNFVSDKEYGENSKFCSVEIEGNYKVKGTYHNKTTEKIGVFNAQIDLTPYPYPMGDIPVNPNLFEVSLKDNGINYTITIPASIYIKPFESEKLLFKLKANDISYHMLDVNMITSDYKKIKGNEISIFLFNPKSLKEQKKTEAFIQQKNHIFTSNGFEKNDTLSIRHEPGINGTIIGKISLNEKVVHREKKASVNGSEWYYVSHDYIWGWVNGKFLTNNKNE